ncbi:MAG: hypothetical protein NTU61_05830 [Candidatus Altiarchaeota archaeon]|nr:hypothetical protein [Candidatus Altiarchaeota archaeon]
MVNWKFWQRGPAEQQLPEQRVLMTETERNAFVELLMPTSDAEKLHAAVDSLGKSKELQVIVWSASKISSHKQGSIIKTPSLIHPDKTVTYQAAALELMYVVSDCGENKRELLKTVSGLSKLSEVDGITDPKGGIEVLRQLKGYIDEQRNSDAIKKAAEKFKK